MEPVVLAVSASVDVAVSPAALFAFVSDAPAKARLNPCVQVIRVEQETPGPLQAGSVTLFRLQKGTRIFEYRMRCLQVEPNQRIISQADLPTRFVVTLDVAPLPTGSRLTHSEECELVPELLEALPVPRRAERAWRVMKVLHFIMPELARDTYDVIVRERAEALRVGMQQELRVWLDAIKAHLEAAV